MQIREYPNKQEYKEMLAQKPSRANLVVPVGVQILADTETPVSVLSKFMDEDSLFLFESVEGGEHWGRHSFLGFSPHLEIQIFKDFVKVSKKGKVEEIQHNGEPLDVLRKIASQYHHAELAGLPKFKGGLVGYFAYEMVSFFEPRVKSKLPPEQPLAHLILPEIVLAFDNVHHTLDIMSFAFSEDDFQDAKDRLDYVIEKLSEPGLKDSQDFKGNFVPKPLMEPEEFRAIVEKIKKHIVAGDIIQCVPSQAFVCDAPSDLLGLYRAQRFINPSPYLYFMKLGNVTLVGSSPETMIRVEDGIATLRPIAGTRPRGKTVEEDLQLAEELLKDEKEVAEHVMLVDLGRNELGRIAKAGTVNVSDLMIIEKYSHVMHIVSNIKAELGDSYDIFDVLKAAFPAGTLSGAPKVRAMEIIAECETRPRGNYGGAVGYMSFDGKMDFAICIRTAVVQNGKLTLQAGAGIVADSDPEKERQETINKAKSVARALEML